MLSKFRLPVGLSLALVPALALLLFMGSWQALKAQRVGAEIAVEKAALDLPAIDFEPDAELLAYRVVKLSGELVPDRSINIAGHSVLGVTGEHRTTLLRLDTGHGILINRGWVPKGWTDPDQATRLIHLEAMIRPAPNVSLEQARRYNDPELGYWIVASPQHLKQVWQEPEILPYIAYAIKPGEARHRLGRDSLPLGHFRALDRSNRHWGYALTWFCLALALITVYLMICFQSHKQKVNP